MQGSYQGRMVLIETPLIGTDGLTEKINHTRKEIWYAAIDDDEEAISIVRKLSSNSPDISINILGPASLNDYMNIDVGEAKSFY